MNFKKEKALHCAKYREILRGTLEIQAYRLVFKFHMLFPLHKYLTSALLYSEKRSEKLYINSASVLTSHLPKQYK